MRNKVLCFFCDIQETIVGENPNQSIDYQNFSDILDNLKCVFGVDYVIFSLISSDSMESVFKEKDILEPYFSSGIIMGKQFFGNGYIDGDTIYYCKGNLKSIRIATYIKELSQRYLIEDVFYADDCQLYHEVLGLLTKKNASYPKIHSIIPKTNSGLIEVNELLENSIGECSLSKVKVR